jgi:alpha-galactosidase
MVSIELDQYPASHLDIIRHWIGFYHAHRDTIIHGDFCPELHLGHVPVIYFRGAAETIIGLYDDAPVTLAQAGGKTWLLNASARDWIAIEEGSLQGSRRVITRDKYGRIASDSAVDFPVSRLKVEVGGSIEIEAFGQA